MARLSIIDPDSTRAGPQTHDMCACACVRVCSLLLGCVLVRMRAYACIRYVCSRLLIISWAARSRVSVVRALLWEDPESVVGWYIGRTLLTQFGERFSKRVDTYTACFMCLAVAALVATLIYLWLVRGTNPSYP